MKKIMFNDEFFLTQAVLEGRKTQTRRFVGLEVFSRTSLTAKIIDRIFKSNNGEYLFECEGKSCKLPKNKYPKYKVGEIVAVAQRYSELYENPNKKISYGCYKDSVAWNNKMFVNAEMMPHQIKITNVRLERLQDISYQDCLDEGIVRDTMEYPDEYHPEYFYHFGLYSDDSYENGYKTPQEAYAALIDKICGKGTWDKNPWVWVYKFELIK